MKAKSTLLGACLALALAGCSGGGGPSGNDSMESELQKAAESAPPQKPGGEWKAKSGGGVSAEESALQRAQRN